MQICGIAILSFGLAVDVARHSARSAACNSTSHGTAGLACGKTANKRAKQSAANSASGSAFTRAVFVLPQLVNRLIALRIIIDLGFLVAIFAGAARDQQSCSKKKAQGYAGKPLHKNRLLNKG